MATKPKLQTVENELEALDAANKNLRIWSALSKTDPSQTKGFKRAGGFSGTAVKPIWVVKRLTEQFGPCGEGWGIGEPKFEVIPAGGSEMLVYCTVPCWHTAPTNVIYGVGGDKVVTARQNGPFCDDEAFKKAFTDAVNNAFKFIGVAADIHMGLFDDNKYVQGLQQEFANDEGSPGPTPRVKLEGQWTSKTALKGGVHAILNGIRKCKAEEEIDEILKKPANKDTIKQAERDWPELITGDPRIEGDLGLKGFVTRKREELRGSLSYQLLVSTLQECETTNDLKRWMSEHGDKIGGLDDAESRKFEELYDTHEQTLKALEQENA